MICPDCLEEFVLVGFEVDPHTLEHRGVFKCDCAERFVFPEYITRQMISDDEVKERMRISRLLYLQNAVKPSSCTENATFKGAIRIHSRHLSRYLEDFSEKSARLLK